MNINYAEVVCIKICLNQYAIHNKNKSGVKKLTTGYTDSIWKPNAWNKMQCRYFFWKQGNGQQ